MSTTKGLLTEAMTMLGQDPKVVFMGYNVLYGKAAGTMSGVPEEKLIEMPLAENLMTGAAIGFSLDGFIPVVWYERCDFLTCGMDAIVNHLNHIGKLSDGQHKPACIIRVCIGNKHIPLFTGPTHCQNFANAMDSMVDFPVLTLWWNKPLILLRYQEALERAREGISTMIFEFKDQWDA